MTNRRPRSTASPYPALVGVDVFAQCAAYHDLATTKGPWQRTRHWCTGNALRLQIGN